MELQERTSGVTTHSNVIFLLNIDILQAEHPSKAAVEVFAFKDHAGSPNTLLNDNGQSFSQSICGCHMVNGEAQARDWQA